MSDIGSGDEGSSSQKYHQGMDQGNAEYDPECGKIASSNDGLAVQKNPILEGSRSARADGTRTGDKDAPDSEQTLLPRRETESKRQVYKGSEIGADGRRSQIFLALSTAAEFRDHLSAFSDYYSSLGPPNPDNLPEDGKLKSEMMLKDNRRYYLDLKENSRGRFLRVSQTITRGGPRSQVAIPAQGMIEFRDALTDLLDEFSVDEAAYRQELPEGRHLHVDNKNFYFDIGQNARGVYMRISEVKTNFRTAITVPEKSWPRFRDILADYCDKVKQQQAQHQTDHSLGNGTQQDTGPAHK